MSVPKIFDGQYFTVSEHNEETGYITARCCECNETKKGYSTSTGNFISHYSKKHPGELSTLKEYIKSGKLQSKLRQPVLKEILQSVDQTVVRLNNFFCF